MIFGIMRDRLEKRTQKSESSGSRMRGCVLRRGAVCAGKRGVLRRGAVCYGGVPCDTEGCCVLRKGMGLC